jgi:hypothetical protein
MLINKLNKNSDIFFQFLNLHIVRIINIVNQHDFLDYLFKNEKTRKIHYKSKINF